MASILIVDDQPEICELLALIAAAAGYKAVVADSGEAALKIIMEEPIELILLDVQLKGMDGFETARRIREAISERWIPIVFVTASTDTESYQKGIDSGGDDYLIKPINTVVLQAKIKAMMRIADTQEKLNEVIKQLTYVSERDDLTNLYGRKAFIKNAQYYKDCAVRDRQPYSILMVDVDYFKNFNDLYGHVKGDRCLQQVAKVLSNEVQRECDLVSRYGGEEFVIWLYDTSFEAAMKIAERLRSAIETKQIPHQGSEVSEVLTASIGVASSSETQQPSLIAMVKLADSHLYKAKDKGRNQVLGSQV